MLLRSKQLVLANSNINIILASNLVSNFFIKQLYFKIIYILIQNNQCLYNKFYYF